MPVGRAGDVCLTLPKFCKCCLVAKGHTPFQPLILLDRLGSFLGFLVMLSLELDSEGCSSFGNISCTC